MGIADGRRKVTKRRRRESMSRMCCLAVAAGCAAIALHETTGAGRAEAERDTAVSEAGHMMAALAHARGAAKMQVAEEAARVAALEGQLQEARAAAEKAPAEVAVVPPELAAQVGALQKELSAAGATNTRLAEKIEEQRVALQVVDGLRKDLAEAKRAEGEAQEKSTAVQGEMDEMKAALLVAAAKESEPAAPVDAVEEEPTAPARWALGISYDASKAYAALCFDRDSLRMGAAHGAAGEEGLRESTANRTACGATFRFVHDRAMERVYAARITVPLVADGPKDKLIENVKLVGLFLKTFAPAMKNGEAWVAGAAEALAKKDGSQREVVLDSTYKVTAYNDGHGVYTFVVESPHEDLDE